MPPSMNYSQLMGFTRTCVLVLAGIASLSAFGQAPVSELPDGPTEKLRNASAPAVIRCKCF